MRPTVMAINEANIISDLPSYPVFRGQDLSDRPYTPFTNRSAYGDAVLEYQENVRRYQRAYEYNLEQSRRQGLRTAQEVSPAVHMTYLQMIKNWLKKRFTRRNRTARIAPDPIYTMGPAPVFARYSPKGRKSRKKRKKTRRKNKKMKGGGTKYICHIPSEKQKKYVKYKEPEVDGEEIKDSDGNKLDYKAYDNNNEQCKYIYKRPGIQIELPRTEIQYKDNKSYLEDIYNKVYRSSPPSICFNEKENDTIQEIVCKFKLDDHKVLTKEQLLQLLQEELNRIEEEEKRNTDESRKEQLNKQKEKIAAEKKQREEANKEWNEIMAKDDASKIKCKEDLEQLDINPEHENPCKILGEVKEKKAFEMVRNNIAKLCGIESNQQNLEIAKKYKFCPIYDAIDPDDGNKNTLNKDQKWNPETEQYNDMWPIKHDGRDPQTLGQLHKYYNEKKEEQETIDTRLANIAAGEFWGGKRRKKKSRKKRKKTRRKKNKNKRKTIKR